MSLIAAAWALGAEGLEPSAKLVLILAADAADPDDRAFNIGRIQRLANLTDEGFRLAVGELALAGFAILGAGTNPVTGDKEPCLILVTGGAS